MTTIVAKRDPTTGEVWIGADRQLSDEGNDIREMAPRRKILAARDALWGATGALPNIQRAERIIRGSCGGLPVLTEADVIAVADLLADGLFAGKESAPWWVVATAEGVFDLYGTGSVMPAPPEGTALGSGRSHALAVLYDRATEPARETVLRALRAASALDVWTGGGIDLWRVGDPAPETEAA